jgi:hypothetical protein
MTPLVRVSELPPGNGKLSLEDAKETRMSKVESLEQEIRKLSPQELAELMTWLQKYDAELWDRQIEDDARAGRLDRLAKKALESYHAGKHIEL